MHLAPIPSCPKPLPFSPLVIVREKQTVHSQGGGGVLPYKKDRGTCRSFYGLKKVVSLTVFGLKRSTAGAFALKTF